MDVAEQEDPSSILSEELINQLQGSAGSAQLLVTTSRSKRKMSVEADEASPDPVLSKRMKRKLEQLQKRKENETKRIQYLGDIDKHKLSDCQQELMVSTRHVGQKNTARWKLEMILKRHRAGLPLTDQEQDLLGGYLDRQRVESSDEEGDAVGRHSSGPSKRSKLESSATPGHSGALTTCHSKPDMEARMSTCANELEHELPKSAHSVIAPNDHDASFQHSSPMLLQPADNSPLSLGERLMAQFQLIKTKTECANALNSGPETTAMVQDTDMAAPSHKIFVPKAERNAMDELIRMHEDARTGKPHKSSTGDDALRASEEKKRFFVNRTDDIQLARMQLPICGMEQEIVEAINNNDAVILCGETGSGKSTQVPQFLYEAGYCSVEGVKIGITQPRRVAASSTAIRVAVEMNCPIDGLGRLISPNHEVSSQKRSKKKSKGNMEPKKQLVGYQVRHDASTMTADTCIKYMTDGILLREITSDLLLRTYSVIILDEAHERNVNTDVLLGMLSRALILRRNQAMNEMAVFYSLPDAERSKYHAPIKPLKLVIMSATLRINDFLNDRLFPNPGSLPPVIKVEARQYPVTPHFARRTEIRNYLKVVYKKVIQIHKKLPDGGVLVFLTGKKEILHLTNKLRRYFSKRNMAVPAVACDDPSDLGEAASLDMPSMWDASDELMDIEEERYSPRSRSGKKGRRGDSTKINQNEDITHLEDVDSDDSFGSIRSSDSEGDNSDFSSDEDVVENKKMVKVTEVQKIGTETAANSSEVSVAEDRLRSERNLLLKQLLMGGGIEDAIADVTTEVVPQSDEQSSNLASEPVLPSCDDDNEIGPKDALVLPLFAMLSAEQQAKVFDKPPVGSRLIVIATNIAETSITIPGIRYVVDCGRYKEKVVNSASGVSKYEVHWISKASADQRMGRAGRTGPGHCYRLFSSAFYDQHMKEFQEPEILKTPLEDLLLQMRTLGIDDVEHFPFPTPPSENALRNALNTLRYIAAVNDVNSSVNIKADNNKIRDKTLNKSSKITALGKLISKFPISARYAKMLVVAYKSAGLPAPLVCALVAVLTERPPFISRRNKVNLLGETKEDDSGSDADDAVDQAELSFHHTSDALARLRTIGAYQHVQKTDLKEAFDKNHRSKKVMKNQDASTKFCIKHNLHKPSLDRAVDLYRQLLSLYNTVFNENQIANEMSGDELRPPSASEEIALRQILLAGLPDCVARRAKVGTITAGNRKQRLTAYFSCNPNVTRPLYIHPESCLYRKDPTASLPEYVVYGQLVENDAGTSTYMTSVTAIDASWIPEIARDCPLLKFSPPLETPQPTYDKDEDQVKCYVVPVYGVLNWELTPIRIKLSEACRNINSSGPILPMIADQSESLASQLGTLPGYRKSDEAVRWFARLLLEGHVLDTAMIKGIFVKQNVKLNLATLTSMKVTKSGSPLLLKLAKARICTLKQLSEKLSEEPSFLFEELQNCLHVEVRKQFRQQWNKFVRALNNDVDKIL